MIALRPRHKLLLGLACGIYSTPTFAAKDIGPVIATACAGDPTSDVLRRRLAEAVLNQAGVLGSDLLADASLPQGLSYGDRAMAAVKRGKVAGFADPTMDIRSMQQRLEQYLRAVPAMAADARKLEIVTPPASYGWLFDSSQPIAIRCANAKPPKPIIKQFEDPTERPRIALREKVDELGLTGDPAKKAGAARIGLKRTRTEKDDGSHKTVTSLSVTGTLGIRLTSNNAVSPVYAYAGYALSQERTRPDPDPNKKQSDGDVHALETGISFSSMLLRSEADWSLTGSLQAAHVADFAKDALRLKIRGSLTPGFAGSLRPLCDMGGFTDVTALGLKFRTRCTLTLEAEGSHVLEAGSADFKDHGEFLGVGGRVGYQIAAPMGDKAGVLGGIGFRYLPTIAGTAPDLKRWDATFKYRFWTESGLALDFGLTWVKGHEPISYTKEDKIELGFGLVH